MSEELQKQTHELVTRIDERLANHVDRFEEHMEQEEKRFDRVEVTLYGNGQPGLTSRTQLLEHGARARTSRRAAILSAVLSLLGALLVYWLTR